MSRGPKGEKRPPDVIGNAVIIARIATGEIEDIITAEDDKNAVAVAHGREGAGRRDVRKEASGISQKGNKSPLGTITSKHLT
jgi:hypothetical protein